MKLASSYSYTNVACVPTDLAVTNKPDIDG